jgi:predicted phage terminase large subunit-like protein
VRCRSLIQSDWYSDKWGEYTALKSDSNGKEEYHNISTGWRMASSVGGGVTGNRGDRVILDDPHSVQGADSEAIREGTLRWFSEELPSRLNNLDKSVIIVIMQRVHERDVSGLILAEELGYEHLMLPMEYEPDRCCYSTIKPKYIQVPKKEIVLWNAETNSWQPSESQDKTELGAEIRWKADPRTEQDELLWPERFSKRSVEELQKALRAWGGSYAEAGQLQQRPAPRGGGMFKLEDWQYCDASNVPKGGREVRGWDLAATDAKTNKTAAYTACVKMKVVNDIVYILDVKRKQEGPAGVEAMIKMVAEEDGKRCIQDFPQDPGQAGKAQKLSICRMLHGYDFKFGLESGSKEMRATPLASQVEVKNVYLVRGHWNSDFTKEGAMFPNGKFKDQIDGATRAYHRCLMAPKTMAVAGGGVID